MDGTTRHRDVRLLVVDDDPRVREAIVSLIDASVEGVTGLHADTSVSALRMTNRARPEIAIVDVSSSDLAGGFELVRNLVGRCGAVIAMSGSSSARAGALASGAAAFFDKGAPPDRVIQLVLGALSRQVDVREVVHP